MFPSRIVPALSASVVAVCLASTAKADSLTGTIIQQTATSHAGTSLNASSASASVGSGIEFTNVLSSSVVSDVDIYQDFSDTGLTISFATANSYLGMISGDGKPLLSLTYTDTAFTGPYAFQGFTCTTNSFCDPVTSSSYNTSFSGSTLTVNFFQLETGESLRFAPSVATTPEPGSLALTLTGLLGSMGVLRRKFSAAASA